MKRVVVTGIGIWSCIGQNVNNVLKSLQNGVSGIGVADDRLQYGISTPLIGVVPRPLLKDLTHRQRIGLAEHSEYAYMAAHDAFRSAQIDSNYLLDNEVGILFGNDTSSRAIVEMHEEICLEHDSQILDSGAFFRVVNSGVTMNLCTLFHLRGLSLTVGGACASGGHAIALGTMMIRNGLQDVMLVGGATEINPFGTAIAVDTLGVLASIGEDDPTKICRPFDQHRRGIVLSGGAAALVLEDYDHAVARGATILAEVAGYGFSTNGTEDISMPNNESEYIAMQRALKDAGVTTDEVDYVNAHATSTPLGDAEEAIALTRLFKGKKAWISSTKSMTGHECWMAGASEAVYSILMMQNNFIAPNINLDQVIDEAKDLKIACKTIYQPVNIVLSNSFGMGGTNNSLVFRKI